MANRCRRFRKVSTKQFKMLDMVGLLVASLCCSQKLYPFSYTFLTQRVMSIYILHVIFASSTLVLLIMLFYFYVVHMMYDSGSLSLALITHPTMWSDSCCATCVKTNDAAAPSAIRTMLNGRQHFFALLCRNGSRLQLFRKLFRFIIIFGALAWNAGEAASRSRGQ